MDENENYAGEVASHPLVQALSQGHPVLAGITALVSTQYQRDQEEAVTTMLHGLHAKLQNIESRYIDETFLETSDGRRLMAHLVGVVLRDSREEKINSAIALAVNLRIRSRLTVDEKELFVHTLDQLNPLQISIIKRVVTDMRERGDEHNRAFGWESLRNEYQSRGIKPTVFSQALKVLESNGLINRNTAMAQEVGRTHYITEFGEEFSDFISDILDNSAPYLEQVV